MKQTQRRILVISLVCLMVVAFMPVVAQGFGEGATGPDVYAVQGMLKSLGSYAGEIDGQYGPTTAAGVRYFQSMYGLPVTGQVDDKTLESILWAYGELKLPKQQEQSEPEDDPKYDLPSLSAEELEMIELVNEERVKAGLSPLTADVELSRVARIKSSDMIEKDYFSHTSPTYGSPFDMMKSFGISFRSAGENLACNRSVAAAHQALMESEGHRQNILSSDYTHIGIGIVEGGMCGAMYTQMFIGK